MENIEDNEKKEFTLFIAKRIGIGILIAVIGILVFTFSYNYINQPEKIQSSHTIDNNQTKAVSKAPGTHEHKAALPFSENQVSENQDLAQSHSEKEQHENTDHKKTEKQLTSINKEPDNLTQPTPEKKEITGHEPNISDSEKTISKDTAHTSDLKNLKDHEADKPDIHNSGQDISKDKAHEESLHTVHPDWPKGVAFVKAVIKPLEHELTERFWGWRPNDILDFTDNVNNFQLGVLEVTRRTVVVLAERISRAGNTSAYDENLENSMNWFMVKAERYWFPSPESKYKAGLEELQEYMERLKQKKAKFYTRTDNLIPLLVAYQNLLGSCDENLVTETDADNKPISSFSADNYFFYAQGVASTMHTILKAVYEDFQGTIDPRKGLEDLHHAIESCGQAMEINPLIITNSKLGGILANHRANLAAPISHARFYLGVLIKTLST